MMKERKTTIITICLVLIMIISSLIIFKRVDNSMSVKVKDSNQMCSAEMYFTEDKYIIYNYCLDSIKYRGVELKELLNDGMDIDELIDTLDEDEIYKDGGSKMYRGKDISILKCKTIDGNNDIYIGTKNMKYEDSFCKNKQKTFTRTYNILNIAESNSDKYLYLTLRQFQAEEVETVKVERKDFSNVEVGKNYEITFENRSIKKDLIKDIFNNSKVIEVVETTKVGLEQVNEAF